MSVDCAVCYVSDLNFLLPSIISAAGLRRFIPSHKADIFIFTVSVDADTIKRVNRFLEEQHITVLSIEDRVFSRIDKEKLAKTRTPLATFGRFFMEDLLPPSCQRIVYVDGDTWINQDPARLIEAVVPEGRFAAAEDTIFFRQNFNFGSTAHDIKTYFKNLGLDPKNGYFNAGVFAVSRGTWKTLSQQAYSFFLDNRDACRHFDQSALNAVMGDRRLRLSSRWNFQTQLKFWNTERYVDPCIYHFNRFPKPWMGACDPWQDMDPKYEAAVSTFRELNLPLRKLGDAELAGCRAQAQKSYGYLQWPGVSRLALMAMGYGNIEQSSWM